jgi:hypothetical protein
MSRHHTLIMNFQALLNKAIDEYYAQHNEMNKNNTDFEPLEERQPKDDTAQKITRAFKLRHILLDVDYNTDDAGGDHSVIVPDQRWLKKENHGEDELKEMSKIVSFIVLSGKLLYEDPCVCLRVEWDQEE